MSHMLHGIPVVVTPGHHRKLPDELVPGQVPWPPGFKEEIDAWMRSFFKPWNVVPDGQCYVLGGNRIHMNPRTFAHLQKATR